MRAAGSGSGMMKQAVEEAEQGQPPSHTPAGHQPHLQVVGHIHVRHAGQRADFAAAQAPLRTYGIHQHLWPHEGVVRVPAATNSCRSPAVQHWAGGKHVLTRTPKEQECARVHTWSVMNRLLISLCIWLATRARRRGWACACVRACVRAWVCACEGHEAWFAWTQACCLAPTDGQWSQVV